MTTSSLIGLWLLAVADPAEAAPSSEQTETTAPSPEQMEGAAQPTANESAAAASAPDVKAAAAALKRAWQAVEEGDAERAVQAVRTGLDADPEHVELLALGARVAYQQGENARSVELWNRLLALDPYNDRARLALAKAYAAAGKSAAADAVLDTVLERHPGLAEAKTLREQLTTRRGAKDAGQWDVAARVDISSAFDSNAARISGALADITTNAAAMMQAELAGIVKRDFGIGPTMAMARLTSANPVMQRSTLKAFAPTTAGVGLIQVLKAGWFKGAVDLRYQETFSDLFNTHRQRLVTPVLWGAAKLGQRHELRLLGGAAYRQPFNTPGLVDNMTYRLGLRETFRPNSAWELAVDVAVRRNAPLTVLPQTNIFLPLDFDELTGTLYARYAVLEEYLEIFALAEAQGRRFRQGNIANESTYRAVAGARVPFEYFELHAEYAFTANLAEAPRDFTRHQAVLGVRAWYQ